MVAVVAAAAVALRARSQFNIDKGKCFRVLTADQRHADGSASGGTGGMQRRDLRLIASVGLVA